MPRPFAALRRLVGARPSDPPGHGRPRLRRAFGVDDWEGSIGTARPDLLWPVLATRLAAGTCPPGART